MLNFILLIEEAAVVECGLFFELLDLLVHGCNISQVLSNLACAWFVIKRIRNPVQLRRLRIC